jgi:chemotaxis protein MotB
MMPKKGEAEKENNERWLITYSDLITLLLIFFIILYSMSQINAAKFTEFSQSMAIVLGQTGRSGVLDGGRSVIPSDQATYKPRHNMTNTKEQIKRMIAQMGLEGKITVREEQRGLVISVKDTVFFKAGSADLGDQAREIILTVGNILKDIPNPIRIEGHTDNIPIHTFRFFSNWELSTARATNVLHSLIESSQITPDRLSAAGYSQFKPVAPNNTESGRGANRRVDIVVIGDDLEKLEPSAESNLVSKIDTEIPGTTKITRDTVTDGEL